MGSFGFFLKHSWNDIKRRKCHFCLAYCSVFITVLATLIVNTVIDKGPIIFLSLNQQETGEIDSYLNMASAYDDSVNTYCDDNNFLNYTKVEELGVTKEYNVVSRYHKCYASIKGVPQDYPFPG